MPDSPLIDEALREQLSSSIAIVIATRDAKMVPEIARAWGPRVLEDGHTLLLAVDRAPAEKALRNLRENGAIAATFVRNDYRSVQLKGWCLEIGEEDAVGEVAIAEHHRIYANSLAAYGVPGHISRNHWSNSVFRLRLHIEAVFDQTPGPGAGQPR